MVIINEKRYSGTVMPSGEEKITVVIGTTDFYQDVVAAMSDVTEITEVGDNGRTKTYRVTAPLSASIVSQNVYSLVFSTKQTNIRALEEKAQELSDVIDALIVMLLEE